MTKITLIKERGNTVIQINSQILKPLFFGFLGSFVIWGSSATIVHLLHGFTPPSHVKLKNPTKDVKNIVCFSVMWIFTSIGDHLHIGINQKTCWGYVVLKSWRWQMSSRHPWNNSTVNQLRAHPHIWFNPTIANFFESKLSMWQDITKQNMNKKNSWNNLQNHLNWCQRGQLNCLPLYYGA